MELEIIRHYQPTGDLIYYQDQEPDRSSPADETKCYLSLFAGKKLLLIAPFAHFLRSRANRETFTKVWSKTGKPWFCPSSVDSIELPYGYDTSTQKMFSDALQLLNVIQSRIADKEFDVALIAAGGLAIPIAGFVKKLGRVGISLGGHLQVLFGVNGNRWRNRESWQERYFNEWWVDLPAACKPSAVGVSDNGAYW